MNKPLNLKTTWPYGIASLLIILGPTLLGWITTPSGYHFTGAVANHNDFSAYLAAMRQGRNGHWFYQFNFSPENWQPQMMLVVYMLTGKITPAGLSYAGWTGWLRAASLLLTFWVYGKWAKILFSEEPRKQWTTWLLLVFGGGIGWLLWPLLTMAGYENAAMLFPDISDPGWTLGLIGANAPHYMLGLFLETLFFVCFWRVVQKREWKWVWAAAGSALLLGLVYVYNSVVLFAVIGLYALLEAWKKRGIPLEFWVKCAVIVTPLLPLLFYYGYWVNRDPAWAQYVSGAHNFIPPPTWYSLIFGMGIVGLLAVFGAQHWQKTNKEPLLLFWVVGNFLVMYLPILQYSGRFLLGFWVPVATLAAYGLEEVILPRAQTQKWYTHFSKLTPTPYESLRRVLIILTLPSGIIVTLLLAKNVLLQKEFPYYMPSSEVQAMEWLAEHSNPKTDLVLAYYPVGNYFPVLSDTRVFMGQFFLTVNFDEKLTLVETFWEPKTSNQWRQTFIDEWQITYIYQGAYENSLYENDHQIIPIWIYQVSSRS